MKKLILSCIVALMAITANAQFYVGGTLGAGYEKVKVEDHKSSDLTTFQLVPEFGYQIDKVIAVGATLGIGYADDDDDELTQYEISPYIRATFAQAKSVKFFVEGALFLNHSKYEFDGDDDDAFSFNTWGAAVRPGFMVNVSNNVNIIGRATMLQYSKAEKHDIDIKRWNLGIPNEVTIGILINI